MLYIDGFVYMCYFFIGTFQLWYFRITKCAFTIISGFFSCYLFHVQGIATRLQNNELPCVFQKHTPRNMHFNDYRHSWLCVNKRGLFHYNQCWGIAPFKSCSSGKLQKKNTKLYPCCSCVC